MSPYQKRRKPQGYQGTQITTSDMRELLPRFLRRIGQLHRDRPDLVVAGWPEVIGPQLAGMARALSFERGILLVQVANSTLYSLLAQHERPRLLQVLREKFPAVDIKNIAFRLGA